MNRTYLTSVHGVAAILLLLIAPGLLAERNQNQQDEWRETLQFGIDSQVESLLPQLEQAGASDLDEQVIERFAASRSDGLRQAIIEYFQDRESDALVGAVTELLLEQRDPSEQLLRASARYLSARDAEIDDALLDLYMDFAEGSSVLTASVAVEAIGDSGAPSAVERLTSLYEEQSNSDVRAAILRALGKTGSPEALPLLTSIAEDEFEQSALRHYATESIGRVAAPESVDLLTDLLSSPDSVLRAYATLALGFYPEDVSSTALTDALLDSFWRVRVAALQGLAEQGNAAAVPAIAFKARRDPERPVRTEAISTLGVIGTPEALDALADIAGNARGPEVERISALTQLIEHDAAAFEELLTDVVEDEWEREGSRVLDTIGKELSTSGDPRLHALYGRFLEHPNFVIRIYGIRAMGNALIRSEESRLKRLADENTGLIRTTTLAALEKMGISYEPDADADEREGEGEDGPTTDSGSGNPESDW